MRMLICVKVWQLKLYCLSEAGSFNVLTKNEKVVGFIGRKNTWIV